MTRRLLAALVCLCAALSLLAGCGGSGIDEYKEDPAQETGETAEATQEPAAAEEDADQEDASAADAEEPDEAAEEDTAEKGADQEDASAANIQAEDGSAAETDASDDPQSPEAQGDPTEEPEPTATPDPGLGYAAYEPDQVVATYDGDDVTWREYYYSLNYYAGYMQYLRAMGAPFTSWDGTDLDPERTNADLVRSSAKEDMFTYRSLEAMAAAEGVELDADDQKEIQSVFEDSADQYGDGDGECTDEETAAYEEYLEGQFIDRALFDRMSGVNILSEKLFADLYGQEGADYSDKETLAYAEEQGVMACKHILLMTVDTTTGENLSDEEIEEKKAKADELYDQLAAVQDDPEKLEELFDQLMNDNSEDTGLAANPDGYQFVSGVMVPIFETTTQELEEYGLSEPVESDYGFHIILRLPVDPDGSFTASGGSGAPLRTAAAQADFFEKLQAVTDKADIVWQDDFENVDIGEIFGE